VSEIIDEAGVMESPVDALSYAPVLPTNRLLTGRVGPVLLWLALPVLAEQFLNLLVGLVDTYLAGTISKDATAAVGLDTQVDWLAGLLFGFIGMGATALVSRHVGMGQNEKANHFCNQALVIALAIGCGATLLIELLAPFLPRVLDWEPGPAGIAVTFLRIDALGYTVLSVIAIAAACWRGRGDTRTPLYVMCIVNVINSSVSAALRFGWGPLPQVGAPGIAIGTLTARTCGGLIVLGLLLRGRSGLQLRLRELLPRAEALRRLLWVGIPGGIDGVLLWTCQFMFLMIISHLATGADQAATVAAHFVGIRVEALSYLPAFAWATAAATMVGQSLGAGDPRRARISGHLAALQGAAMCAVMGVLYFVLAPQIYAFFNNNPDLARVSAIGVPALRLLAFFQVPLGLCIIYVNALRGAGDTRYPLMFTAVGMILVRLPLAYFCGIYLHGGLIGAWVGMSADILVRAVLAVVRFSRGKWQYIQV
jgi:multidrug resistance protein, MATE family